MNIRIYYQNFIYSPTDAVMSRLKNNINIYFKIYIKTAPTCFVVTVNVNFNVVFKTTHYCISWWINKTFIISRWTVRMRKKSDIYICVCVCVCVCVCARRFPFIAAPRTKCLSLRNPAPTGTRRTSCSATGSYERNAGHTSGPNKKWC